MAMEDSSMMSPADIAALTRGNTGFGGDGISWLVLILLFFGFMGGWILFCLGQYNACSVCRWPCDGNSVSGRSSRIWCNTNCDCRRS